jgi:hypothetical protein
MKYLKLYEEFVSKETKVNWGEAELEIKEMFRIFKELKQLPSELIVDGEKFTIDKSIFNLDEPKEFETQVDDINGKHTDTSKIGPTADEILSMKELTVSDKKVDAKPYYDFIKFCKKVFWKGQKVQLDKTTIQKLADDSQSIGRGEFSNFIKDASEYQRLSKAYDNTMTFLKEKGAEDKFNTTGLFSKYPDINKKDYNDAVHYFDYYGKSYLFFEEQIRKGGKMPITSAIEIEGKWYIVGGNRRMSFYVLSGIDPVIWLTKL